MRINAMSRGLLVLDKSLENLKYPLMNRNFKVIIAPQDIGCEGIANDILSCRIFVTQNSKDFLRLATELEIGIISCDNLKDLSPDSISKIISDAYTDFEIRTHMGTGWVLKLDLKDSHDFKQLF